MCPIRSDGIKFPPRRILRREGGRRTFLDFIMMNVVMESERKALAGQWSHDLVAWREGGGGSPVRSTEFGEIRNWGWWQEEGERNKGMSRTKKWSWTLSRIWIGQRGWSRMTSQFFSWWVAVVIVCVCVRAVLCMTRCRWCLDCLVNDWASPNGSTTFAPLASRVWGIFYEREGDDWVLRIGTSAERMRQIWSWNGQFLRVTSSGCFVDLTCLARQGNGFVVVFAFVFLSRKWKE